MGDFNTYGGSDEENAEIKRLNFELVRASTVLAPWLPLLRATRATRVTRPLATFY